MIEISKDEGMNKLLNQVIDQALKKGYLSFCPQAHEIVEEENYKRKGFSSEDINGLVTPSFKDYFKKNKEVFLEFYKEFGLWSAIKIISIKTPWAYWCWTIDSMQYLTDYVAEDKLYKIEAKDVTEDQKKEYLANNFIKLSDGLYVSNYDKSNMLYDPLVKPYALEDGWSTEQIGEILKEWFSHIVKKDIKVKYKRGSEW